MATLLRTLCLLSLFFHEAYGQFGHSFFFNPFNPLKSLFGGRQGYLGPGMTAKQGYTEGILGGEGAARSFIPPHFRGGFGGGIGGFGGGIGQGIGRGYGGIVRGGGAEDSGIEEPAYVPDLPDKESGIDKQTPNNFKTNFMGEWEVVSENSGVSAMHMVLLRHNKLVWFDSTVFGSSDLPLPGDDRECRLITNTENDVDCYAHAIEFDIATSAIRPLRVKTDPWCSSGGLNADGTLIQTGGWGDGFRSVRILKPCDDCDWNDANPQGLASDRWYASQQILPEGNFFLVGGRKEFNYEFVPADGVGIGRQRYDLPFLQETTDESENNLYPFVHLSTDGNLFIFANNRAILLDPKNKKVVLEFPPLKGGARNYPGSGMSALLPIKIDGKNDKDFPAQVVVCGGAKPEANKVAEVSKGANLMTALKDCGKIKITDGANAKWKIEIMPTPRVMGDMLILPTGDLLLINGAMKGVSGWYFGDEPCLKPVLYRPTRSRAERFVELKATTIPRMYHSSSAVLPDGRILVAGSNPNNMYNFTNVKYITDLRVEKFSPPYLDPLLESQKPVILSTFDNRMFSYGQDFVIDISLAATGVTRQDFKVTLYAPPYTTHGFSQGQRLVILKIQDVRGNGIGNRSINVLAPPLATIAPPGYYLLSVVYRGLPSKAVWVKIG